jgi:hypothetical protein
MTYTATPINKIITNGVLVVTVTFSNSDNGDSFNFDFSTTQVQSETWLEEQVQNKLSNLNALPVALDSIEIGNLIQPTQPSTTNTNIDYEQYKANLKTFQQMVNAIQQGVMTKDNPAFIALKAQLTADFSVDYIDLF